ncbi:MAG: energy-coupling factor ABC transporter permease [Eubacteriales bacterium]|nr:energy-coupling factor ABC transporter permease [Eubacteriales bacterium]
MHMADALLSPAVGLAGYACSAATTGVALKKLNLEENEKKIPVMGVMGAFVFSAQMINFTIPGTGSSGHLCGGMLLSAILGPYAGFLTMIAVLAIQCLLFADGGILALGCNVWNMAFYGCFVGGGIIWLLFNRKHISRKGIILASVLGNIISLQLGAFSVTLETLASGITELPFSVFLASMQPIHLAIGTVEGLITAAVLLFIYETRPEILWGVEGKEKENTRFSLKGVLTILSAAFVFIGGFLSLFASSHPDGLEWSMERITGSTELASHGLLYEVLEKIQETTAILPDYAFSFSESAMGTSFSGVFGALVVLILCVIFCLILKKVKKNRIHE